MVNADDQAECPIVFVHLGKRLPRFAAANIRMATKFSGLPVVLLTDATVEEHDLSDARVVPIDSSWYSTERIETFKARSGMNPTFRDGFWFAAIERLFVVADAMNALGFTRVLHAESDVFMFDVAHAPSALDAIGKSCYFPFAFQNRVVASFCYFNDGGSFGAMCDWLSEQVGNLNEMNLLAAYARQFPQEVRFLPTEATFAESPGDWRADIQTVDANTLGGIVDANAMGWWLFGIDPRNCSGPTYSRYSDRDAHRSAHAPELLYFWFDPEAMKLSVSSVNQPLRPKKVLCLHIHAKVHSRLESSQLLQRVVSDSQREKRTLIWIGIPPTVRPGRTLLPSRWAHALRTRRFREI